jgi:hypothetical protein
MGIVRFALRFPHTFYVVAGLMLFLGGSAILVTPKDIFPPINIPVVPELPGRTFHGTVARHADALDQQTRTMLTEVDVDNDDGTLARDFTVWCICGNHACNRWCWCPHRR